MDDPSPATDANQSKGSTGKATNWRQRYKGSAAQDLISGLGGIEFGDRIILFGAALLLSVLPLIILLSALASERVDDDIGPSWVSWRLWGALGFVESDCLISSC